MEKNINISDLDYMCQHETKYMDSTSKSICEKYLVDKVVTDELLKIYAEKEIETWGDMADGEITFVYGNKIITGKYVDEDFPAKILSIQTV